MATQLNIISNVLALLGHSAITTLSNPDEITTAAIQAYDLLLPGVLSRNNWRFATKIREIYRFQKNFTIAAPPSTDITATGIGIEDGVITRVYFKTTDRLPSVDANRTIYPNQDLYAVRVGDDNTFKVYPTREDAHFDTNVYTFQNNGLGTHTVFKCANEESTWKSIYPIPDDFLKLIRIHPQHYQYEMYSTYVSEAASVKTFAPYYYSTGEDLYMTLEYVFQPEPGTFPQRFTEYFVYEIAVYLALSNAQRPDYFSVLEQKRQQAFAMAAASEAQNRPSFSQANFPTLSRQVGLLDLPNALS